MKLYRHWKHMEPLSSAVICLGVFDGLHRGHQALLQTALEQASHRGVASALLSFEPNPRRYFARQSGQPVWPRLMRFRDQYHYLKAAGVDRYHAIPFNQELATLPGEAFVKNVLCGQLGAVGLVVGDDFRFGFQRRCGIDNLKTWSGELGFDLTVIPAVTMDDGRRCSSSLLRELLAKGDFDAVTSLLGRPYALSGTVRPGDGRGRQIGVPTANVQIPTDALPLDGVYAVSVKTPTEKKCYGVANIGQQPTFSGTKKRLEVSVFNFNRQAYGECWEVSIHAFIRPVKRFPSLNALIKQIEKDQKTAWNYLMT